MPARFPFNYRNGSAWPYCIFWFLGCLVAFISSGDRDQALAERRAAVAAGRAPPVVLIVRGTELLKGGHHEFHHWQIELYDQQMHQMVQRNLKAVQDDIPPCRTGDAEAAFRCGPSDYLIPAFDHPTGRARWLILFVGVCPALVGFVLGRFRHSRIADPMPLSLVR